MKIDTKLYLNDEDLEALRKASSILKAYDLAVGGGKSLVTYETLETLGNKRNYMDVGQKVSDFIGGVNLLQAVFIFKHIKDDK